MFKVVFISILFLALLEFFVWKPDFFVLGGIFLVFVFTALINSLFKDTHTVLVATMIYLSAFFLSFGFSVSLGQIVVLVLVGSLLATVLNKMPLATSKSSLKYLLVLISLFFWFAGVFRLVSFVGLSSFLGLIILVFGVWLMTSIQFAEYDKRFLYGGIFAIAFAEIGWAAFFLPFSYLTIGAILFIIYYIAWDIFSKALRFRLTRSVLLKDIFVLVGTLTVLLATTPWLP